MEWILISFAILMATFGASSGVVYYYHRFFGRYIQNRILQEKQIAIYEEIICMVGNVKAVLDYTSGDETVRQWREALMEPLREMLRKSYQWSIFLPENLHDLPAQYASQLAHRLNRLDQITSDDIHEVADIIAELKKIENDSAQTLHQKIRETIGVD